MGYVAGIEHRVSASSRIPVVLITGASAGLGLALTRKLLPLKWRLILTARADSLPRFTVAGIHSSDRVWLRPLDVTRAEERAAVVSEALEKWDGVDILVNNAGVAYRAVCEHVAEEDHRAQMDVNYLGPMDLIHRVLPRMRERREGRILNVSSVSGMMAMPTMALYSASKFALEGATEALWYEVRPFGIKVTLVQPGFIHSESFQNTRYTALSRAAVDAPDNPYYRHYQRMAGFIARFMERSRATPEAVATRMVHLMHARRPPLRMAATEDAHLFTWLRRMLPRRLYHEVLYRSLPGVRRWGHTEPGAPGGLGGG
jgi:hypothetical protein